MRRQRLLTLIALLTVGTVGGVFLAKTGQPTRKSRAWTFVSDARCLGGCTDSALLSVLPGGPTSSQLATGILTDTRGGAVTDSRSPGAYCQKATASDPANLCQTPEQIGWGVGWSLNGSASPVVTQNACYAPDGTKTASLVVFPATAAGNSTQLFTSLPVTSGLPYTWSFSVKSTSGSGTFYGNFQGTGNNADFSYSYSPDSWTRVSASNTPASTTTGFFVIGANSVTFPAEQATGIVSLCVWGAKVAQSASDSTYTSPLQVAIAGSTPCVEPNGLRSEVASTNLVLRSSDFANAAWTKNLTTVTAAYGIAPDGTLTAQRLQLAGAANVHQSATVTGAIVTGSAWLRATSGTVSNVSVALANASSGFSAMSSTTPTLTTTWQLVSTSSASFVSGNSIDLAVQIPSGAADVEAWNAQLEVQPYATSPVATAGSTVTRAADVINYTAYGIASTNGCAYASVMPKWTGNAPASSKILSSSDGSTVFFGATSGAATIYSDDGTSSFNVPAGYTANTKKQYALCWNANARILQNLTDGWANAGAAFATPFSSIILSTLTPFGGWLTDVRAGGATSSPVFVAALGDSITAGVVAAASSYPHLLQASRGNSWAIVNDGNAGDTASAVLTRWTNGIRAQKPQHVVLLAGVNDVLASTAAATIWGNLQSLADQARADGATVHLMTVMPFGNAAAWTAGKQTILTALNASITSYCTTNSLRCIDAYAGMGDTDPTKLKAAYDNGDGLHPNAAGNAALAALVQAQL